MTSRPGKSIYRWTRVDLAVKVCANALSKRRVKVEIMLVLAAILAICGSTTASLTLAKSTKEAPAIYSNR